MAKFMKNNNKFIALLMLIMFLLFSFTPSTNVFASKLSTEGYQEEEIMEIHEDLEPVLRLNDGLFYNDIARGAGTWLIEQLGSILGYFEKGVNKIISIGDFYNMDGVKRIIDTLMPFILGLFLLTLIIVWIYVNILDT